MTDLAMALHLPASAFQPVLGPAPEEGSHAGASCLEAIHYPLPDANAADIANSASCAAHEDKGLLTLIHSDSCQGLKVHLFSMSDKIHLYLLHDAQRA